MAIEYIGTPDIKVFPSAFRNGDEEAKRTTEENLIKFNRLSSFSDNLEQMFIDPDDSDYVIFNIHGYWFRCLITSIPEGNNLFAYIKLEKVAGVGWKLSAIDGGALDDGTDFKGLSFTSNSSDIPSGNATTKYYSLQVTNNTGELNYQKLKLDSTEIRNGDSTKSISEEFNTGNLTAESVETIQLKVSTITSENEDDIIAIDKNIKTAENKTIDIDGDVDINGNITIGSGGLITGAKNINMVGEVNIPSGSKIALGANKEISINNSEIKLGSISINSDSTGMEITSPHNESIFFHSDKSGEVAFIDDIPDIPEAIKNPHSLTIKRNNTTVGTYDGSSAKEINITDENTTYSKMSLVEGQVGELLIPRTIDAETLKSLIQYHTRQWTYLGTALHSDGEASFPPTSGDFREYMVIYTNSQDGKYSDMTEVVCGHVDLVNGMKLPGYEGTSSIECTNKSILITWEDPGSGVETKSFVTVYAK